MAVSVKKAILWRGEVDNNRTSSSREHSYLRLWFSSGVTTFQKASSGQRFSTIGSSRSRRIARDIGCSRPNVAFANSRHRHRINRP
jgi:hypothetical protein